MATNGVLGTLRELFPEFPRDEMATLLAQVVIQRQPAVLTADELLARVSEAIMDQMENEHAVHAAMQGDESLIEVVQPPPATGRVEQQQQQQQKPGRPRHPEPKQQQQQRHNVDDEDDDDDGGGGGGEYDDGDAVSFDGGDDGVDLRAVVAPPLSAEDEVLSCFPEASREWIVAELATLGGGSNAVAVLCDRMLTKKDFPKRPQLAAGAAAAAAAGNRLSTVNFFLNAGEHPLNNDEMAASLVLLKNRFRDISVPYLTDIHFKNNGHYATTCKTITDIMKQAEPTATYYGATGQLKRLKNLRALLPVPALTALVQAEVDFVERNFKRDKEEADHLFAQELNEQEYEEAGQQIECGCCFGSQSFEQMVQCNDGHLFCCDCLKHYVEESAFGGGSTAISCMSSDGCPAIFSMEQLRKALPSTLFEKFESRQQDEALTKADIVGLVRCPAANCSFAMVLEDDVKVFECQNPQCGKRTCKLCKEDWAEHFGLKCTEVEGKQKTNARTTIEEKMTEALKRNCPKCGTAFYKDEGCNKMTCRCGTLMCYICRVMIPPKIGYAHFCAHGLPAGKECTKCDLCPLWTNAAQDDARAVEEARVAAQRELGDAAPDGPVGPQEPPPKKKQKR